MSSVGHHGLGYSLLYPYQGFWFTDPVLESIKDFQQNLKALDSDLILASQPKSGTTWMKALAFAIANRTRYPIFSSSHPLLTTSPHDLVPFADFKHFHKEHSLLDYTNTSSQDLPSRLIATHLPYPLLPESVKDGATKCKIVYICRNPRDTFVSVWHFMNKIGDNKKSGTPLSIEDAFEYFCDGVSDFGPYWDHVLGYWKESLASPHKVLFVKYEDLMNEPETQVKKLAEFLGYGFSVEEESRGVIKEIISLCSFQHLKNLDANKQEQSGDNFLAHNKDFFRKGEVGDWKNYLTPTMVERLDSLTKEKLQGSGLAFRSE
ncbi:hypothetical protein MKW94_029504 [Papaver nudicaule]|uniref:Sulfotransferase n=1 Tax=Papaver nudicaule TaxID=74823 RepID=A0AA41SEX3_PAPNU|nr:hypothetical protein [Papaver nudicaule]